MDVEKWFKQSDEDFAVAKILLVQQKYYMVAFLCHQALEKDLKGLYILTTRDDTLKIHSLVQLGKLVEIPKSLLSHLRDISPQYTISRYPDMTEDAPFELYDESIAKAILEKTTEVKQWIQKKRN